MQSAQHIYFYPGNTLRHTFASDGSVTFGGTITNAPSTDGAYAMFVNQQHATGWGLRIAGGADSSDNLINAQNGSGTEKFVVKSDGSATFAGTITAGGGPVMSKPVWSGWQGSHNQTSGSWQTPTLNTHILSMDTEYATISTNEITIVQAGYYKVQFTVLSHVTDGQRLQRIEVDGSNVHYGYHNSAEGWNSEFSHYSGYMANGTTIQFFSQVGGTDPYAWHSLDASRHSFATLIYLGK